MGRERWVVKGSDLILCRCNLIGKGILCAILIAANIVFATWSTSTQDDGLAQSEESVGNRPIEVSLSL